MYNERFSASFAWQVTKAVLFSVAFAVLSTFVFALLLRFTPLSNKAVTPVVAILKTLSVLFGILFCVRGDKGLWKGILSGVLSSMATRLCFSALAGSFSSGGWILLELLIGGVAGGICGVFAVNLRK